MDHSPASSQISPTGEISVVDMHTGGEPLRIITSGYPPIPSGTILEKRAYVRDNLDQYRRMLMFEPRGHFDMYGALLVEPDLPGADIAVLFMHNEGYSTMCGHAVIALARYAVDQQIVPVTLPVTTVQIECPCGMVEAHVEIKNGRPGTVSFESVPSYLFARDMTLKLPGNRVVTFDIAYGGAFYALIDAAQFGLKFGQSPLRDFTDAASELTSTIQDEFEISHPDHEDLGFLYGTILTDGGDGAHGVPSTNICVFADAQVDRSPTGSGVTARMAAAHAKGQVELGESRLFRSITGADFTGKALRASHVGEYSAVSVEVSGQAYYTGTAHFTLEPDDPLGGGFLLR